MARPSKMGGKRSEPKARNAKPAKGRKTTKTKRRIAPAAVRVKRRSVSGPTNDLKEARAQQASTAEILKVIASSPSDVQPVFEAIAASANRLLSGFSTAVSRFIDGMVHLAAFTPVNPTADAALRSTFPAPTAVLPAFVLAAQGEPAQIADTEALADKRLLEISRARGYRSVLFVPLMNGGLPIGMISVARVAPGRFARHHVQLLQTFADQAVIAIENARLFNETQEALERQTATAAVLEVINSSRGNLNPVFDAILRKAHALCGIASGSLELYDGERFVGVAAHGHSETFADVLRAGYIATESPATVPLLAGYRVSHIHDAREVDFPVFRAAALIDGIRTVLFVPLRKEGRLLGMIAAARHEVRQFSEKEIGLLENFAVQAAIAIENARLFNETQEALERQTATADILKVIASSPDDVQPVFEAIAERSNRIVDGRSTAVYSLVGEMLHLMALTPISPDADAALRAMFPRELSRFPWGDAIRRREVYQTLDVQSAWIILPEARELAERRGFRSMMVVPLVSEKKTIGVIGVTRAAPGKFADHHVQLLQTFADQAVIAISNVELFREVQQRTRDLSRSLDDLRNAQDRLVQTEKLASLGQLTAGIAHEIKNPLNFVNNFSALSAELTCELNDLLKDAALTDKMREEVTELTRLLHDNLEKVVQHGKRADSIVKNMLLHSREGSREQRPADVNTLVDESLNLAYHGARAEKSGFEITLQRDFDGNAGIVELFPQEISRALLNLLSNGFYAATRRKAENGGAGAEPTVLATTKNLGSSVEIRIRDNGAGIPPEIREKMFNPFFTTKPTGEGTGLGLSMTHDIIVKQHGGRIDVETRLGEFTEFIITLPRNNRAAPG
jgi:signal transduction histidine kinase